MVFSSVAMRTADLSQTNQMDPLVCFVHDYSEAPLEWYKHYDVHLFSGRGEIPKPCMYLGEPHWFGGLLPHGAARLMKRDAETQPYHNGNYKSWGHEHEWIADMKCLHKLVRLSSIVEPTDREYFKYFAHLVEQKIYRIKHSGDETDLSKVVRGKR